MKRQLDTDDTDLSDIFKRPKQTTTTNTDITTTTTTATTPEAITIRCSEPFEGGEYRRTLTIPIYDGSMEIDEFCRSVHDKMSSTSCRPIQDQDAYFEYLRDTSAAAAAAAAATATAAAENDHQQQQQQQQQQMLMMMIIKERDDAIAEIEYLREKIRVAESKSLKEEEEEETLAAPRDDDDDDTCPNPIPDGEEEQQQ